MEWDKLIASFDVLRRAGWWEMVDDEWKARDGVATLKACESAAKNGSNSRGARAVAKFVLYTAHRLWGMGEPRNYEPSWRQDMDADSQAAHDVWQKQRCEVRCT